MYRFYVHNLAFLPTTHRIMKNKKIKTSPLEYKNYLVLTATKKIKDNSIESQELSM